MPDYIYLLQTRLTTAQQKALAGVRDVARARNLTVFLVGGAVRDLTNGTSIRDLDVVIQGSAPKLRKEIEKAGGVLTGQSEPMQSLYFSFPGGVRMEVGSTLEIAYLKPGKPVAKPATILDDLRRRDFTANAMAISLNEGSYGLLMDPLNGIADIENQELRLVSNYGFIEDPVRMMRAVRLSARMGWHMEEKTQKRYDAGKTEGYISALSPAQRGYEVEEIFHEEDPLRVLRRLESEGWMKALYPALTSAKANESELSRLRDTAGQLQSMGIYPDTSAAVFPLLAAKLQPKDISGLKKLFARPGYVTQIEKLESETKAFSAEFMSKAAAAPSDAWKMLMSAVPERVLWLAQSNKTAAVQNRFKAFFTEWPTARQRIPYALMQEMRITPELPIYDELLDKLFFELMNGKLETPEATRAFLEPFSPPAPPPPVNLRRRTLKRETKPAKSRAKKTAAAAPVEGIALDAAAEATVPVTKSKAAVAPAKAVEAKLAEKAVAAKAPVKVAAKKEVKAAAVKVVAKKMPAKKAVAKKPVAKKTVKKATKPVAKKTAKKAAPKTSAKKSPAKKTATKKPVAKKAVKKAAKPVAKKAVKKSVKKSVKGRR